MVTQTMLQHYVHSFKLRILLQLMVNMPRVRKYDSMELNRPTEELLFIMSCARKSLLHAELTGALIHLYINRE